MRESRREGAVNKKVDVKNYWLDVFYFYSPQKDEQKTKKVDFTLS